MDELCRLFEQISTIQATIHHQSAAATLQKRYTIHREGRALHICVLQGHASMPERLTMLRWTKEKRRTKHEEKIVGSIHESKMCRYSAADSDKNPTDGHRSMVHFEVSRCRSAPIIVVVFTLSSNGLHNGQRLDRHFHRSRKDTNKRTCAKPRMRHNNKNKHPL